MKTNTCKTCGESKPINEFYRNFNSKSGYQNTCKYCIVEKRNKRTKKHKRVMSDDEIKEAADLSNIILSRRDELLEMLR